MKKPLVLFGTGKREAYYRNLLNDIGVKFNYYVDNDFRKTKTYFYGKKVLPARCLSSNCKILITSDLYKTDILQQLENNNLQECVIEVEDIVKEVLATELKSIQNEYSAGEQITVIFDILSGCGWAGTEMWSFQLAKGLIVRRKKAIVYGTIEQPEIPEFENLVQRFNLKKKGFFLRLLQTMAKSLPFVYINNFGSVGLLAASLLKEQCPESVQIISVIHSDLSGIYERNARNRNITDLWLCVSAKIRNHFVLKYKIPEAKVLGKINFVKFDKELVRSYSPVSIPLKICWVSRLCKEQKRTDLLPAFIKYLLQWCPVFILNIVGKGEYYEKLESFIKENSLSGIVNLLGYLPSEEMPNFFRTQDIYLNFSDYEGSCLAMLEAMANGCVPIVTRVSGVDEMVINDVNGFSREVGDVIGLAQCVNVLDTDRKKLREFGIKSKEKIKEKCTMEKYLDFFQTLYDLK